MCATLVTTSYVARGAPGRRACCVGVVDLDLCLEDIVSRERVTARLPVPWGQAPIKRPRALRARPFDLRGCERGALGALSVRRAVSPAVFTVLFVCCPRALCALAASRPAPGARMASAWLQAAVWAWPRDRSVRRRIAAGRARRSLLCVEVVLPHPPQHGEEDALEAVRDDLGAQACGAEGTRGRRGVPRVDWGGRYNRRRACAATLSGAPGSGAGRAVVGRGGGLVVGAPRKKSPESPSFSTIIAKALR